MSQARNLANLGVHTTTSAGAVTFLDGATNVDIAQHDGTNGLALGGTVITAVSATNKWCPSDPPAMVATLTMLGFAIGIFP